MTCLTALVLSAAGCADTPPATIEPFRDIAYQAIGSRQPWGLIIGDDRIVLWPMHGDRHGVWARTEPVADGAARTWRTGEGSDAITIVTRPGPCGDDQERLHPDFVEVTMGDDGPTLTGCGGPGAMRR